MPKPSENFINKLINSLDEMFPEPKCELRYSNLYELIIAVVLSAQTTDNRVNIVTKELFLKYPTYQDLSKASLIDVESIIKSIGLYHNKAKNIISLSKNLENINPTQEDLMKLDGIGRKSANVILSEYFKIPAIAVDTHVLRTSERLGLAKGTPIEVEKKLMKAFKKEIWSKMHLQLVLLGRYVCTSRNPKCNLCLIKDCPRR